MELEEKLMEVEPTCIYGTVQESIMYDMKDILKEKLLDYRLTKITCMIKSKSSIYGIKFTYRNILNCEEKDIIEVKSKESDLIVQEMELNNEEIIDLRVWEKDVKLIGFEVTTNKKRVQKFGYGTDEDLIIIDDFKDHDQIIVGFGCYADDKDGVTALYAYYTNKKKYISTIYSGIFALKIKLKDPDFKKKIEEKVIKMSEKNKILYRVCNLPDNQFFSVIKYSIQ